jgi:hypothetical protein
MRNPVADEALQDIARPLGGKTSGGAGGGSCGGAARRRDCAINPTMTSATATRNRTVAE